VALTLLFEAHFPLVVRSAVAFAGRGILAEDLVGEACVGFLEAISRFDPARGFRLMTYATWWMRRRLAEAVAQQARAVRLPRRDRSAAGATREVPWSELPPADEARLSIAPDAAAALDRASRRNALRAAVGALRERERAVLVRHHGLSGREETLAEIAHDFGVSKERVRQLEAAALARLRDALSRFQAR
jgi:RNA polymerase primary sigma factor